MKKLIAIALAAAALFPAMEAKTVTETRPVRSFDKLEASSALNIIYTQGTPAGFKISGDEKDVAAIKIKQSGGKLKIWRADNRQKKNGKSNAVTVTITTPRLSEIELSGACDFSAKRLSSNGDIEIETDGASKVSISDLKARKVEIDCSGASNIKVAKSSTRKMELDLSGASKVSIAGNTGYLDLDCDGATKADLGKLAAAEGSVDLSGASSVTTNIRSIRKRDTRGASSFKNR